MKRANHHAHLRGGATANVIFAVLALGLCGLCTVQFRREGQLRGVMEDLSRTNAAVTGQLEEARKEGNRWKGEVTDLTTRFAEADSQLRTNKVEISALQVQLRGATNNVASLTRSRDAFKSRFEEQADITRKATEATLKLKTDAEAEIKRIAAIAEERTATANKYAADYKELLAAFEKFRAQAQAAPATPSK